MRGARPPSSKKVLVRGPGGAHKIGEVLVNA